MTVTLPLLPFVALYGPMSRWRWFGREPWILDRRPVFFHLIHAGCGGNKKKEKQHVGGIKTCTSGWHKMKGYMSEERSSKILSLTLFVSIHDDRKPETSLAFKLIYDPQTLGDPVWKLFFFLLTFGCVEGWKGRRSSHIFPSFFSSPLCVNMELFSLSLGGDSGLGIY